MGVPFPVEELAWLVKDNLHAKHLVLSVEELFVEFLECPLSEEETLALEPMESYQRMLLHRLADLFGLVHESVGEGEDRHLVVDRGEDSLIPAVLVSDVLECVDGETQHPLLARQLLKRNTSGTDGSQTPTTSKNHGLSFEERQTAYSAARQRIFSGKLKYPEETSKDTGSMRPKANSIVARRMIAHALGKPKGTGIGSPSMGSITGQDMDVRSVVGTDADRIFVDSPTSAKMSPGDIKESIQQSSAKAAKRMFANALGLPPTGSSPRMTVRQVSCKIGTCSLPSQSGNDKILNSNMEVHKNSSSDRANISEIRSQSTHTTGESVRVTPARAARNARPGGAACRIFAQALGLPDPVCSSEVSRPASIQ